MATSVTIEAGSWMRVVNTNVTKTAPAATMARTSIGRLAPVSERIRRWAAVIMVKITRATALPIDAIPAGTYRVAIQQFDEKHNDALQHKYNPPSTPLLYEVTREDDQVIDIDLPKKLP